MKKFLFLFILAACLSAFQLIPDKVYLTTPLYFPTIDSNKIENLNSETIELGRRLFYDPILSLNHKTSCASCHQQRYAFSSGNLKRNIGSSGNPLLRNTPGLFNLVWNDVFFWDGRASSLEAVSSFPLTHPNEMNSNWRIISERLMLSNTYRKSFQTCFGKLTIDSSSVSLAIAQFLKTIVSANSRFDSIVRGESIFTEDELAGYEIANEFSLGGCIHCHPLDGNVLGSISDFANIGLDQTADQKLFKDSGRFVFTGLTKDIGRFKIPSIRNLGFTEPYMHDGRFATLEQVINFYSDSVVASNSLDSRIFVHTEGNRLSQKQKKQLIIFLNSLNDYSLLTNPQWSNPKGINQR